MTTQAVSRDSMKSTWRFSNRDQWTISHWLIEVLNVSHVSFGADIPVHSKEEKVPYVPQWSMHIWVLLHAFIPLAVHQIWVSFFSPQGLGRFVVFNLYFSAFNLVVVHETYVLRRLAHRYGFLDGDKHKRGDVPDVGVYKVVASLYKTTGSRLVMTMLLTYNMSQPPLASWEKYLWSLPLKIGLYGIVIDFWYYWYHRAMHHIKPLWKFHRTHHLTKYPITLLAAYADHEQEFFDMAFIPFLTYWSLKAMGVSMDFYEWWVCHQYVVFTEVFGHSGLRIYMAAPSTLSWLLKIFDAEIVIEDHDLHHRKGWRKSHNYGKQTRVWDRVFGTSHDRIESMESNVDYVNTAHVPLF